ncbi:MAG: WD40/YVTN/BNR-like repeat-containing protein [Betaproteobacteria bacterium]
MRLVFRLCAVACVCAIAPVLRAQSFDESLLAHFAWRSVGPAGAGGRVTDVAVAGTGPQRIYVAFATGGVWKSSSEGTAWEPIFDHEGVSSIGDLAVDPANPDTVWVGTGEVNPRNSVSWGDGVYKTTDAGRTWTNLGLANTRHIGRVLVDPRNPDVVYVAALGHIWGPGRDRGVYKTTDGGRTWTSSLFVNDDTGVVDLAMDPGDSNTLYAAAYEVRRDRFAGGDPEKGWGPGSGLYKTTDAGRTWRRLTRGLPEGLLGRIGVDVSASDPSVVYAIVQTPTTVPRESEAGPVRTAPEGRRTMKDGGVFRSEDRGETWTWVNAIDPRPFYHSQIRVDPADANHVYVLGSPIAESLDGGRTFHNQPWNIHVDHHALWIDPRNPRHMINGNDGGVYMTWDGGRSWDFQNQMAVSQLYSVDVDMRQPYYIYGGVQDYCSWGGPSATRKSVGIQVSDWYKVQTGDGFQVRVDPTDYTIVYAESQNGGLVRHDLKSGRNTSIKPVAPYDKPPYRFNWETPILISSHDPRTLYVGGNYVFRSGDRGDSWTIISPELPTAKQGTITVLSESPKDASVLYAGTDDGNVFATRDGGAKWTNLPARFPGMPGRRWVSRVVASRYDAGTAYVAFDGHRDDDFAVHLFKTTDYGATWTSIAGDLPAGAPVRVIREDVRNPHLWFAGTETAAYASLDAGAHWIRLMNGMPTVPVADLIVHPRDDDLVAATHGRSFYVMDISPLQELTPQVLASDAHLFTVKPGIAFDYRVFTTDEFLAQKRFIADNPPAGVTISYYLKSAPDGDVKLAVLDANGSMVRELTATKEKGINRVQWDLRGKAPAQTPRPGAAAGGAAAAAAGPFGRAPQGDLVDPGAFTARLTVGGRELTTPITVEPDPDVAMTVEQRTDRRKVVDDVLGLQAKTEPLSARAESASDQLHALAKSVAAVPKVPADATRALDAAVKAADDVKTAAAKLNRTTLQLFSQISGSPFQPTATERAELADLLKEYDKQSAAFDTLTKTTIPGIEKQLNDAGVPRIVIKES